MKRSPDEILVRPVITEKTSALQFDGTDAGGGGDDGGPVKTKYTFEVVTDATKSQIRRAVQEMFDVTVVDVRTMNVRGKARRTRGRRQKGRKADWKKAIVTVGEDDVIDLYEGV